MAGACGDDDNNVCPEDASEIKIQGTGSEEAEYWVREDGDTDWRPVALASGPSSTVCVQRDYQFLARCGGWDQEFRRTLEDVPELAVFYCGAATPPTPSVNLTVTMAQPGSLYVGGTGEFSTSPAWAAMFAVPRGTHEMVGITAAGRFTRQSVNLGDDESVELDLTDTIPLSPFTFAAPELEADENAFTHILLRTARDRSVARTYAWIATREASMDRQRVPVAVLAPGDEQEASLSLLSRAGVRGSIQVLENEQFLTLSSVPRLVGRVTLTQEPARASWTVGEPALAGFDELRLSAARLATGEGRVVSATRAWSDAHGAGVLSFEGAPGDDLAIGFDSVTFEARRHGPSGVWYSNLVLPCPTGGC